MEALKKSWFWRFISGAYGYNGPSFFDFLRLNSETTRLFNKIEREMKRDGLL